MNDFSILVSGFTLNDFLDILIVSVVFYRLFSIIQGTRALQVLVGTAVITSLYFLSLTFELYSLNWILKSFFDYFFIILIILFQEQLRTALAIFGQTRIWGRKKKSYYDNQIEEVVTACSALSKEKTGALILFERNHGLLNYSSTGTKLDSKIHSDLIYSLFQNSSPLHDGAVIIYQNRLQAAGCFLPLSKNLDIDRQYGTRHRAALGISEISDALVIIVSEESGNISLCFNGKFKICNDEHELRKELRTNLYSARLDNRELRYAA